ncbi:MAG: hypothetical protein HKM05_07565 [Spirochaetales bacterium]|nr:hypothetical protein [Spirochaetales bacterium]
MQGYELIQPRRVLGVQPWGPSAFVMRFERRGLRFRAGTHVDVGLPGGLTRPYSLFSGEQDEIAEILVRLVPGGAVSSRLARLKEGDLVLVKPPRGGFTLRHREQKDRLVLVATGTGIAPFRSFVRTVPELPYLLVHGVRSLDEDFGADFEANQERVLCLSSAEGRQPVATEKFSKHCRIVPGRVTQWLDQAELHIDRDRFYLCGNSAMLREATEILARRGVPLERIHRENSAT